MKAITTIICLLLISCATQKKAEKFYAKHPDKLAKTCSETFPVRDTTIVKDSVRFDTLYTEGEPVFIKDSFFIKGDTIVRVTDKKCPQSLIITKTVTKDSFIIRRDMAREYYLNARIDTATHLLDSARDQIAKDEAKIHDKNRRIWWLIVALALSWAWILRHPILSLLNPIKKFYPF